MKLKHIFLSVTLITGAAMADSTLVYNDNKGAEISRIMLSDGLAKITNKTDAKTALIFDATGNRFTILDHEGKTYMVMGEKEIEALGNVSAMIDRMLEEQLAQMPAAQREQMRGMMKSMLEKQMPKQAALPTYEKSGQSTSYNGFTCDKVIQFQEGKKESDFCVADYQALGVSADEYQGIQRFMKIAEKLAGQFGQNQSMNFASIGEVLPVQYKMDQDTATLTAVKHDDLPAQTFQVPEGYSQQELPKELFK